MAAVLHCVVQSKFLSTAGRAIVWCTKTHQRKRETHSDNGGPLNQCMRVPVGCPQNLHLFWCRRCKKLFHHKKTSLVSLSHVKSELLGAAFSELSFISGVETGGKKVIWGSPNVCLKCSDMQWVKCKHAIGLRWAAVGLSPPTAAPPFSFPRTPPLEWDFP